MRAAPTGGLNEESINEADLDELSTLMCRQRLEDRYRQTITRRKRAYLPYEGAAEWARMLGLKNEGEWKDWLELGEGRSSYVPSDPEGVYTARGSWISWSHFLTGGAPDRRVADVERASRCRKEASRASVDGEVLDPSYFATLDYAASGDYVPWDLGGRPQPPVRKAFERGAFGRPKAGPILDCGCGAGDNANWLASRGHDVCGFDLCPGAVAEATRRSRTIFEDSIREAGGSATFSVASCLDLQGSEISRVAEAHRGFSVVVDSALLHCLDDASQKQYVSQLAKVTRCGGRLYLGCFSDANPEPWSNPRRLSEAHIRSLFDIPAWAVLDVDPVWYERPQQKGSGMGAFTMAFWCVIERRGAF